MVKDGWKECSENAPAGVYTQNIVFREVFYHQFFVHMLKSTNEIYVTLGVTGLPYKSGFKHQLMFQGVTAKSFDNFFPPSPECVIFRLDKELR